MLPRFTQTITRSMIGQKWTSASAAARLFRVADEPSRFLAEAAPNAEDVEVDSGEESDEVVHVARVRAQKLPEPQGWIDGAPTSAFDHSCAMCGAAIVEWVHPLAAEHVRFVRYGKDATWASYCTLCDPCERIYASGDDEAVVELMKASDRWR
jgi:hypothetical protein